MSGESPREVLIEIQFIGQVARVAAIDVATGVEVVIQGPANAARADLEAAVMQKLKWVLDGGAAGQAGAGPTGSGRGKLV